MKALVINGSPKKKGTVAKLLRAVTQGFGSETRVEWVDIYESSIRPCAGCMRCRKGSGCVLPRDDGHRLGALIDESDMLVVGTPTHWGNMSSPLKCLFDRNVPMLMEENEGQMPAPRQKGKPAVIVTACSAPWPFDRLLRESRGAIGAVKHVLRYGGFKVVGKLVKPGTKRSTELKERRLRRASRFGAGLERAARRR